MAERDPIGRLTTSMLSQNPAVRSEFERIHAELTQQMDAAVDFAIKSPFPSVDQTEQDVYA